MPTSHINIKLESDYLLKILANLQTDNQFYVWNRGFLEVNIILFV